MCAGSVLVPIQLILSADFPSFFEVTNNKRCTKFDPNTRSDNFSIDTSIWARKFNCFWRVFGDFLFFCPKLALFFWGYEKTSSSYHVQSLRRTGAKTSRFRLGSPALPGRPGLEARLARCVAGWGSAIFGLYAGFGSLRVTALQAGISRWKETAALQRANDAQLPSKLGTIYYHLQLFFVH